jgi:hypothetical protein
VVLDEFSTAYRLPEECHEDVDIKNHKKPKPEQFCNFWLTEECHEDGHVLFERNSLKVLVHLMGPV